MRSPLAVTRTWLASIAAVAIFGIAPGARADGDDALRWLQSGSCKQAGDAINEGMAHEEARAYMLAGYLYAATGCVEPDPARAARYYQRAIDLGDVEARAFLGVMHGLGAGIPQDYRAAYRSFSYGRSGPPPVDEAHEIAYGYASTVTQLARSKVSYPRFSSDQGTVYVTFHSSTGAVTFSSLGRGDEPRRALPRSTPFTNAIASACEEAVRQAPAPVGLPDQDLLYEVPWTFQFK